MQPNKAKLDILLAGIGLVAYPFQGITKSIEATFRSQSRKAIVNARLKSGYYETTRMQMTDEERREILQSFDRFLRAWDT